MFEGDSADTCAEEFPVMSMGGRTEGLACADPGARTPIGLSKKGLCLSLPLLRLTIFIITKPDTLGCQD
jgi:hypothetical protein